MPKIFITGITGTNFFIKSILLTNVYKGYVGGDATYTLLQKYPAWESNITALVRNETKGGLVAKVYPKVKLVYGDLGDLALLEEESSKADIILNWADSDHPLSTEAIVRGAAKHTKDSPVFIIHTSGTGILTWRTVEKKTFGDLDPKVYNDWDGIDEVTSLPDNAAHRNVDKIILAADDSGSVRTAIVCPPTIYGLGRGVGNTRSQQLYELSRMTIQSGKGMRVGKGLNEQTHVHIHDLSDLYVLLVDEAAVGGGKATWGKTGYYFCSRGPQVSNILPFISSLKILTWRVHLQIWGEVGKLVAKAAYQQGLIASDKTFEFTSDELTRSAGHSNAALVFGGNAREKSIRAGKLLDWTPSRGSIFDEISVAVAAEAVRLHIIKP